MHASDGWSRRRSRRAWAFAAALLASLTATLVVTTVPAAASASTDVSVPGASTWSNTTAIVGATSGPAAPYPSTIAVSGASGVISDVDVNLLGMAHQYLEDFEVLLVAPDGTEVLLMADVGGFTSFANLTFDDEAASQLVPTIQATSSGSYRPSPGFLTQEFASPAPAGPYGASLAALDGKGPNGNWSLYVQDDSPTLSGAINGGWSLDIETIAASAGGPYTTDEASGVVLSASTVPVVDGATFAWDLDGDGQFDDATGPNPTLSSFALGLLGFGDGPDSTSFRVRATVGSLSVVSPAATLTVGSSPPIATFGNDGPVTLGDTAQVSFTDQADPSTADVDAGFRYAYDLDDDGDWDIGDGSYAGGSASASATVPTSVLGTPGLYDVRGRILDKDGGETTSTTTITVDPPPNGEPVADAGEDQTVAPRSEVTLDGTGSSDPDGDDVTFFWTQIDGPPVELSDPTSPTPTFVAPAGPEELLFELLVTDVGGSFAADAVAITVSNQPPVADAGPDQRVDPDTVVTLDGSGSSDPDGDALRYEWVLTDGPDVVAISSDGARTSFRAPSDATTLTFRLGVRDGGSVRGFDTVRIVVSTTPNAVAGPDQVVNGGDVVLLDGTGSNDPDGQDLAFAWTQLTGPPVTLDGPAAEPGFIAPEGPAVLVFELTVRDELDVAASDTVTITVNGAPTADAGPDQLVNTGDTVVFDGSGSDDPDGDDVTFAWSQTGGPTVLLVASSTASPTFTAPDGPAVLTFELVVRDERELFDVDTLTITVNGAPVADAGLDTEVVEGQIAVLDGSGSTDPDGDGLAYSWVQDSGPTVALAGVDTDTATFTVPDGDEPLVFTLTVDDGRGRTDTDTVTVTPLPRLTAEESFIDHTYRVLLDRPAGDADLAYWVERIDAGATRTLVARQIGLSIEATRGEVLDDRYERWLGRSPSSADRDFWAPRLLAGEPIQVLEVSVLASAERYAIGGTDAEYVRLVYEALLRRGPSSAEAGFWLDRLASAGRSAVARGILTSTESERIRVDDAYVEILDRPADAAGRDFWVGVLDRTGDLRRVEIGLAAAWVPSTRSAR